MSQNLKQNSKNATNASNNAELFRRLYLSQLDWYKRYPYLGTWEIVKLEFSDDSSEEPIIISNEKIRFELEPNYQLVDRIKNNKKKVANKSIASGIRSSNGVASEALYSSQTSSESESDDFSDDNNNDNNNNNLETSNLNESFSSSDENISIRFLNNKRQMSNKKLSNQPKKSCFLSGDVIWHNLPSNKQLTSFFECHLFEYDEFNKVLKISGPRIFFDFKVLFVTDSDFNSDDLIKSKENLMILKYKDVLNLTCKKVSNDECFDREYNFSNIYNNEFLSDVKIKSSNNNKQFYAHKSIIWLTFKENTPQFLHKITNTDSNLIELILYYCYCDCLPLIIDQSDNKGNMIDVAIDSNGSSSPVLILNENKLIEYIDFVGEYRELTNLKNLLNLYLNNSSYKLQTQNIIKDIKQSFEMINNNFKYEENIVIHERENVFMNPAKLCHSIKNSFENFYLAFVKIIRLLDMYSNKQEQLSKDERHEFIKNIKNCLPFCVEQLRKFLNSIHKLMIQLNEDKKREIAEYMVPDIDSFVDYSLELIKNVDITIEKIVKAKNMAKDNSPSTTSSEEEAEQELNTRNSDSRSSENESPISMGGEQREQNNPKAKKAALKINKQNNNFLQSKNITNKLTKSFKTAIHLKELKKMQKFNQKFKKSFDQVKESLLKYQKTKQDAKLNFVYKELNNFIDNFIQEDIPRFITKLDYLSNNKKLKSGKSRPNKILKLNDFKFGFKLIAAKTQWTLNQIRLNKEIVTPLTNDLCTKLQNSELNNELEKLRIGPVNDKTKKSNGKLSKSLDFSNMNLDSLFKSKPANKNHLAQEALKLYETKYLNDILLEVHDDETKEVRLIEINGALIASRCVWFNRALNSGMQEAISRKVILHDTNINLFEKFIKYLYTGSLNESTSVSQYSIDEIIELLTIADKYECDSLKNLLELKIINLIRTNDEILEKSDLNSILIDYLNFSEQFKLNCLMDTCISLLLKNQTSYRKFLDSNEFKQLSSKIKLKVQEAADFYQKKLNIAAKIGLFGCKKTKMKKIILNPIDHSSSEENFFQDDMNETIMNGEVNSGIPDLNSNRLYELINYAHPLIVLDAHLLENSFNRLKEIIGNTDFNDLTDEQLVKLLIRNDCDLNRVVPIVLKFE